MDQPEALRRAFRSPPQDPDDREAHLAFLDDVGLIAPALPALAGVCSFCRGPKRGRPGLCATCKTVVGRLGHVIDELHVVTMATDGDRFHALMRDYKDVVRLDQREPRREWLFMHAAVLSAYVEAHHKRLLRYDPVVTMVPSDLPLVPAAFDEAAAHGWYALHPVSVGVKSHQWSQRAATKEERLSRSPRDWSVQCNKVVGRPVLVFDDIFTTGCSLVSFAARLREAGAPFIVAVVIERVVGSSYYDKLAQIRSATRWDWRARRLSVGISLSRAERRERHIYV
jgi:hypothetical protein